MAKAKAWEVTDDFWSRVEPLIPVRRRSAEQSYARKVGGGRKAKDPRLVFEAIVYVLRTGCQWRALRSMSSEKRSPSLATVAVACPPEATAKNDS